MEKKIRPARKTCSCGNKVTNHHWLCNKCWGKKNSACQRIIARIEQYKSRVKTIKRAKYRKPTEDIIKKLEEELKECSGRTRPARN